MDNTHKDIQKSAKLYYKMIKQCEKNLKNLRKTCKHPETEKCNYSYRIGDVSEATICSVCGELMESPFSKVWDVQVKESD